MVNLPTKVNYAIVFVTDMERSVMFYHELLNLPIKFESPQWTEFGSNEGTTLALHPADSLSPDGIERGVSPAGSCHPGFVVDDLDTFHRRMEAAVVKVIQPPTLEDVGGRIAIYADPDGLPISVTELERD